MPAQIDPGRSIDRVRNGFNRSVRLRHGPSSITGKTGQPNPWTTVVPVKAKVKFSHTRYLALGPELIPVYRQSARR